MESISPQKYRHQRCLYHFRYFQPLITTFGTVNYDQLCLLQSSGSFKIVFSQLNFQKISSGRFLTVFSKKNFQKIWCLHQDIHFYLLIICFYLFLSVLSVLIYFHLFLSVSIYFYLFLSVFICFHLFSSVSMS